MHHVAYFLVYNVLAKFQLFCIITCRDILYFVFWLPYCHTLWHHQYLICILQKLWISLERYEIWQKWKHHSSSLLKACQIHLFFDTSIFHFIGTLTHESFNQKFQVYSGHYVDPTRKGKQVNDNLAIRNGEWPIQKILKERINPRTVSVKGIVNKLNTMLWSHNFS